jgi:hypothetical protein
VLAAVPEDQLASIAETVDLGAAGFVHDAVPELV